MRLAGRRKWVLVASCCVTFAFWLVARSANGEPRYDAKAIYHSLPTYRPVTEVLTAMPVPPGNYRTSSRIRYMWSGSWTFSENDPPLNYLNWEFDTGHVSLGVDNRGLVVTKQF